MKTPPKGTVLVIDDNPANLAVLFESLRRAKFKVLIAQDGTSGLKRIKLVRPDIILLDIMMPDMDGFELCRRLSKDDTFSQIPIIFLSAMHDTAVKIKALDHQAVDYVTKPFQSEEVVARVERHLTLRNLQRSLKEKNSQLQAEIAERQRMEANLANVVAMSSTLEQEALLPFIVERAKALVNATCCSILVPDEKTGDLFFLTGPEEVIGRCGSIAGEMVAQAFSKQSPIILNRPQEMENSLDSQLAVPLLVAERAIGVLVAKRMKNFSDYELGSLVTLASHAAMALENANLYKKAQQEILERERAEKTLQKYTKKLQLLAQQVISVQEEERQRLSRELHDEAGQALTALQLSLSLIHNDYPDPLLRERLTEAIELTGETHEQLRLMAHNLRPPELDTMPLTSTLANFCRRFASQTGLSIDYWGGNLPTLNHSVNICLYRFLQEALTNVAKHASATQIYVTWRYDSHIVSLSVDDNGVGFAPVEGTTEKMGLGLVGMRERIESLGGRLEINTAPGEGSLLAVHLLVE